MQNAALLNEEVQTHLNRLAELAVAIHTEGLAGDVADLITAETPADRENGIALLGEVATDPIDKTEYQNMVAALGRTPTLNAQAMVNYDLRSAFAGALTTLAL